MSIGRPDIAVTIPDMVQWLKSDRATVDRSAAAGDGRSQMWLNTRRCVRSKSDGPRLARGSSWLPRMPLVSPTAPVLTRPTRPAPPPAPDALSVDRASVYATRNCKPDESRLLRPICSEWYRDSAVV